MDEYDLWVNMNYGGLWIMGEYELWVNINYRGTLEQFKTEKENNFSCRKQISWV